MARYIDVEPIKKQLEKTSINAQTTFINTVLIGLLDEAPTADVAEVVHAQWLEDRMDYVCSHCKSSFSDNLTYIKYPYDMPKFCPECGARMDEKKVE